MRKRLKLRVRIFWVTAMVLGLTLSSKLIVYMIHNFIPFMNWFGEINEYTILAFLILFSIITDAILRRSDDLKNYLNSIVRKINGDKDD